MPGGQLDHVGEPHRLASDDAAARLLHLAPEPLAARPAQSRKMNQIGRRRGRPEGASQPLLQRRLLRRGHSLGAAQDSVAQEPLHDRERAQVIERRQLERLLQRSLAVERAQDAVHLVGQLREPRRQRGEVDCQDRLGRQSELIHLVLHRGSLLAVWPLAIPAATGVHGREATLTRHGVPPDRHPHQPQRQRRRNCHDFHIR